MPLIATGKEYTWETRWFKIRARISNYKWVYFFKIIQTSKRDNSFYYENEVYASDNYKDINKCEKDMIDFVAENYNII